MCCIVTLKVQWTNENIIRIITTIMVIIITIILIIISIIIIIVVIISIYIHLKSVETFQTIFFLTFGFVH